jgi:threonine aldolase
MQFGSDNHTGASAKVLESIATANQGFMHGYGDDDWTAKAVQALKETFECDLDAFFVVTGTAANTLALSCLVQPWESILCHAQAHILLDESTAPEFFTGGARLIPIAQRAGKVTPNHLKAYFQGAGAEAPHHSIVRALSITQVSEIGLVYTPSEITALSQLAQQQGVHLHMDGARFANAVAASGCSPAELTWKAGVDVLCLGATKNGAIAAEAVIFFKPELAAQFIYRRKRSGHLLSKSRFLGAQFVGWLQNRHWLELASHANQHAARLAQELSSIEQIHLAWPTQANEIFAVMPRSLVTALRDAGAEFYDWYPSALPADRDLDDHEALVRLVTSFVTSDSQIEQFCDLVRTKVKT